MKSEDFVAGDMDDRGIPAFLRSAWGIAAGLIAVVTTLVGFSQVFLQKAGLVGGIAAAVVLTAAWLVCWYVWLWRSVRPSAILGTNTPVTYPRWARAAALAGIGVIPLGVGAFALWRQARPLNALGNHSGAVVFMTFAPSDSSLAGRLRRDLMRAQIHVFTAGDLESVGEPLMPKVQDALAGSTHLLLLWSQAAAKDTDLPDQFVAAHLLNKRILPCIVDDAAPPEFLRGLGKVDLRADYLGALAKLGKALDEAPASEGRTPALPAAADPDRQQILDGIYRGQEEVLNTLATRQDRAREVQARLDSVIATALQNWPRDPYVLSLAGYHKKNAHLLKHWDELQNRQYPRDPLLDEAVRFFHESLSVLPDNPGALNGLGSVFMLRGDLNTAEFYVRRAIDRVRGADRGGEYEAAQDDLNTILRLKRERSGNRG